MKYENQDGKLQTNSHETFLHSYIQFTWNYYMSLNGPVMLRNKINLGSYIFIKLLI